MLSHNPTAKLLAKLLRENTSYIYGEITPADDIVVLNQLLFTTAILSGCNDTGYEDRWCYHTREQAFAALEKWRSRDYTGEPEGWHRHPATGRRRDNEGNEWLNL